jgi:hypothetical protein
MSHELRRMYGVLAADVDTTPLDPPEQLRRHVDRRTRMVTAVACVLVATAVVGSLLVGRAFVTSAPPEVGDTPSPLATPSSVATPSPTGPSPSPASVTPSLPIPDDAFVSAPADRAQPDSSEPQDVEGLDWLPRLCNATFPAAQSIEQRTRMIYYNSPPVIPNSVPTGTVHHLISVSDEAVAYMAGLRSLIGDECTTELGSAPGETTIKSRVVPSQTRGDDSLLIEMYWSSTIEDCCPPNPDSTYYVSVTRVGPVLSVIVVQGWEGASVDQADANLFTDRALAAVRGWVQ